MTGYRDLLAAVIHDTTGRVDWDHASPASRKRAYRIADAVLDLARTIGPDASDPPEA